MGGLRAAIVFGVASGIASGIASGCASGPKDEGADIRSLVAGTWGWTNRPESCSANPHGLDLSLDQRRLTVRYAKPTTRYDGTEVTESAYDVLGFEPEEGALLLAMDDEKRLDSDGNPVRWRLRFVEFEGRQAYLWERPDLPGGGWGPIVRCDR